MLHLHAGKGHPMSAVTWEALTMLKQNTHRQQKIQLLDWDVPKYRVWCHCEHDTYDGVRGYG